MVRACGNTWRLLCGGLLLVAAPSCEASPAPGAAHVRADDFDLEGTAWLVRDGMVADGAELQVKVNRYGLNRVDVDDDGRRDLLQVVEERRDVERAFVIRALPSRQPPAQATVPVAEIVVEPGHEQARVTVRYADDVASERAPIVFAAPLAPGTFCQWALEAPRPPFVGADPRRAARRGRN